MKAYTGNAVVSMPGHKGVCREWTQMSCCEAFWVVAGTLVVRLGLLGHMTMDVLQELDTGLAIWRRSDFPQWPLVVLQ